MSGTYHFGIPLVIIMLFALAYSFLPALGCLRNTKIDIRLQCQIIFGRKERVCQVSRIFGIPIIWFVSGSGRLFPSCPGLPEEQTSLKIDIRLQCQIIFGRKYVRYISLWYSLSAFHSGLLFLSCPGLPEEHEDRHQATMPNNIWQEVCQVYRIFGIPIIWFVSGSGRLFPSCPGLPEGQTSLKIDIRLQCQIRFGRKERVCQVYRIFGIPWAIIIWFVSGSGRLFPSCSGCLRAKQTLGKLPAWTSLTVLHAVGPLSCHTCTIMIIGGGRFWIALNFGYQTARNCLQVIADNDVEERFLSRKRELCLRIGV